MQIIQSGPSRQTLRQQAFQGGLDRISQGLMGLGNAIDAKEEKTLRQRALEEQQNVSDYNTALQMTKESGEVVTPEQVRSIRTQGMAPKEDTSFMGALGGIGDDISGFFGGNDKPQSQTVATQGAQPQQSAMLSLLQNAAVQAKSDKSRQGQKRQLEDLQFKKAMNESLEANLPFAETREAQKMAYAESLKNQGAGGKSSAIAKLPVEAQKSIGSIASGMQALEGMQQAMAEGFKPGYVDVDTPLIGRFISDDPFTENRRVLSEVIGRLQSGGAINAEEEGRFNAMSPRAGDDPQSAARKLEMQRQFLENKLSALGVNQDELDKSGISTGAIRSNKSGNLSGVSDMAVPYAPNQALNLSPMSDAVASPMTNHPASQQALDWAAKNPNDPRAAAIMQRIGGGR